MADFDPVSQQDKQRILMALVINYKDSEGRRLSDPFMTLPSRDELPDYYEIIQNPMDFDTIILRIENGAYADLNELERDFNELCINAQLFNSEESIVHQDSIELQKVFTGEKNNLEQ